MSSARVPVVNCEPAEVYVARMEIHLEGLAKGHDPLGHLYGIERLARAARAEWWVSEREAERARNGR